MEGFNLDGDGIANLDDLGPDPADGLDGWKDRGLDAYPDHWQNWPGPAPKIPATRSR